MTREEFNAICNNACQGSPLSIECSQASLGKHRAVSIYLSSPLGFKVRARDQHQTLAYLSAARAEAADAVAGKYRAWLTTWREANQQ